MKPILFASFILSILLICCPAYGADASIPEMNLGGLDPYLRVVWALALVIAIILFIYLLMRKRFTMGSSKDRQINVLETRALMPKKALFLVQVHDKQILLGVSQDSIVSLAEFDVADIKKRSEESSANFSRKLAEEQQKQNQEILAQQIGKKSNANAEKA